MISEVTTANNSIDLHFGNWSDVRLSIVKLLPRALVAFPRSPIHWHEHPFAKELTRLEGNDGRFRGPGAGCAGTLRYLRPGRGIPNAKSTVAATRQQLAPSSIKTSQIDAVVKREEESCRHLRDSMPLHSRFPRSLFRARNPSPPRSPFLLVPSFANRSRTTTLRQTLPRSLVQVLVLHNQI